MNVSNQFILYIKFTIYLISRTQPGRQRELSVKLLRSPISAELSVALCLDTRAKK